MLQDKPSHLPSRRPDGREHREQGDHLRVVGDRELAAHGVAIEAIHRSGLEASEAPVVIIAIGMRDAWRDAIDEILEEGARRERLGREHEVRERDHRVSRHPHVHATPSGNSTYAAR